MMSAPVVSQWYQHRDKGYKFQVVSIDDRERTVEMQHFDGDLEEVDLEDWYSLLVEPIEAPEDFTGPLDDIEMDDLGFTETAMSPEDWLEPLEERSGEQESLD